MTPDEIQKDRAAGTSAFFEARQREVDRIKAAIEPSTYGGDKVDLATYAGHVVTITACTCPAGEAFKAQIAAMATPMPEDE